MRLLKFSVAVLAAAWLMAGCAGQVKMSDAARTQYTYTGTKYGKVSVELAAAVQDDAAKATRAQQLELVNSIIVQLKSNQIYDSQSLAEIKVVVKDIRIRNAFNAVMWGFMSGSDNVAGKVALRSPDGNPLSEFDITASYALGGYAGGQDSMRLGWLSNKFAELTVNTILQKTPGKKSSKNRT